MKSKLLFLLLSLLVASTSFAVVDPVPDHIGFYFDLSADYYNIRVEPFTTVPAHVIVTLPHFDALYGYEFGFQIEGSHIVTNVMLMGTGPIDVGGAPGNHIVGLAAPIVTSEATLLATVNVFVLDGGEVLLTMTGATPNSVPESNMPAVLLAGDEILPVDNPCTFPDGTSYPCAVINPAPFATDEATWGAVKSIYR